MTDKCSRSASVSAIVATIASLIVVIIILVVYFEHLDDSHEKHDHLTGEELPQLCYLAPDPGPCSSQVERWYYLDRIRDCLSFPWGGCGANDNNFVSQTQCRMTCRVETLATPAPLPSSSTIIASVPVPAVRSNKSCSLTPSAGPCRDRITRFYFDSEAKKCQSFQYGGCVGNANNFVTREDCEHTCLPPAPDVEMFSRKPYTSTCHEPASAGSCDGQVTRWRWSDVTGDCVHFTWSGCGGNSNNFRSRKKCLQRCKN